MQRPRRDNGKDPFSTAEWVIFRCTALILLLVTAYKLVEAALKH
jgi:hypothetical protein